MSNRITWILIFAVVPSMVFAKNRTSDNDGFDRVIKTSSKNQIANVDARIVRTRFDKDIDQMVEIQLGSDYRRANVFDFYPLELSSSQVRWKSDKKIRELMDYYEYARKDLEKLNQSKLLRVIKADMNLDSKSDYAVIVRNLNKQKNYLAIINFTETLYLKPFQASYLEIINDGKYPTMAVYKEGKKQENIKTPSFRLVAFDDDSQILYFDREADKWQVLKL
ncbi:MAG: hypothetical protein O3C63_05835 [Cyanobacteria bacterium]|nr:hypothetical protein [Cyanobacteriota bacterium]MDA1020826.1 hypothetical protein [Cyanobacteriota bacterium]